MIKILLVDDDPHIRVIVREYAQAEDWQFTEASDGFSALQLLEKETYSLLVLDIMMPRMDGWAVLKQLRKSSQMPVILLTARDEEYDRLLGFELGVDDYVSKPFSPRELIARMKALLKRSGALIQDKQMIRYGAL
ncbi:MAG: response regulator transcription factor, partial [Bacillota bacterium]|nr:response regulator transcription factor [Bacillota bacterium]